MDNNTNNVQNSPNLNNLIQGDNNIQTQNSNIQNNMNINQANQATMDSQQPVTTVTTTEYSNLQMQNNIPIVTEHPHVDMEAHIKDQLQNIPTVEQNKQDFINNVQNMNQEITEKKSDNINFGFIIILFVIILAVMYFLFPILIKYL